MSIPKLTLSIGQNGTLSYPVAIEVPRNITPGKDGKNVATHDKKVCFVNFEILSDPEIQELLDISEAHSTRLLEAQAKLSAAVSEKDRAKAEKELKEAEKNFKSWRSLFLRRVVVGFPENHGWDAIFHELPKFSPDLVEAMASYRTIGKALDAAYWAMLDPK